VSRPGTVSAAYSAFHGYSVGNQLLALLQCHERGIQPGPIATFLHWKELGRSVRKGEKALTLCQPRTYAKRREDEDAAEELRVIFTYRRGWFVLSQTDGEPYTAPPCPGWDRTLALRTLGITEVPFEHTDGNVLGYAVKGKIAVSPLSPFPAKTTFHELAHCLLHHDQEHREGRELPRSMKEVEAEAVALICLEALALDGAVFARGYIQSWLCGEAIPEQNARRIFHAADSILRAGREQC
jgi:antirestriction protein ArdC